MDEMILLISSSDPENKSFGTGFVIHQQGSTYYVVTCYHVVRDVGGPDRVRIKENLPATLIAFDDETGFDLAVLKVENLTNVLPLPLGNLGERGNQFVAKGFTVEDNRRFVMRPIRGTLGEQIYFESKQRAIRVSAWDLLLPEEYYALRKGYSGSPVIDQASGKVIAVASHRQAEGLRGNAISIDALSHIWPDLPADLITISSDRSGDYEYDIFLSYYVDFSGEWVNRYFFPLLKMGLRRQIGADSDYL